MADGEAPAPGLAQTVADSLGQVFGAEPGRVWVRLERIDRGHYAENGCAVDDDELPVFVHVLHARLPVGEALAAEARSIAGEVAAVLKRSADRVHVEYAPPGAGRIAFGGRLVT